MFVCSHSSPVVSKFTVQKKKDTHKKKYCDIVNVATSILGTILFVNLFHTLD